VATSNEQATFAINLKGNAADAAKSTADAMEQLRLRILAGQGALKDMQGSLRNLRGSTDEVRQAKEELKAKLDAERVAVSKATLELLKQGKSYDKLGEQAKKNAKIKEEADKKAIEKSKALSAAIGTAGGPLAAIRAKLSTLKDIAGEGGAGGAMSFLALGVAGLVAGLAALVVGVGAVAVGFGKFILKGADAARSARLLREALMGGNAQWTKNYGEQIDALALKVPTAKSEIEKLGASLAKNNIGGQTWVDTLNAATQASAALGDDAGAKIKEFVERGKLLQRFQINPQEMIGSGVSFDDVAQALSKSMKVGVQEAKAALFEGRVKLADGAAALRAAVEKKFAGINLRQMLSFDNLLKKLGETFDSFTKDVDLEPLVNGFKDLFSVFSLNEQSGQALKQIVEVFAKDLIGSFTTGTPLAKKFIYGLILGAQELTITYLKVRNAIRETFSNSETLKNVNLLKAALDAGKFIAVGFAVGLGAVAIAVASVGAIMVGSVLLVTTAVNAISDAIKGAYEYLKKLDFKDVAFSIIDGLVGGLSSGSAISLLSNAVKGLGESAKKSFKETLGIHSPSKVFADFGESTTEGYAQGVEKGSDRAQGAVNSMVGAPSGGGRGGAAPNITVQIFASGGNGKEVAAAVSEQSILEKLTEAVLDAMQGAGVPYPR
jgi:hypothetical protein